RTSHRWWHSSATRSCSSRGWRPEHRHSAGRRVTSCSRCSVRGRGGCLSAGCSACKSTQLPDPMGALPRPRQPARANSCGQRLQPGLAGSASLLLLAVSTHIVKNTAAVPLLWIIPLAIYLLTFILCFDGRGWYRREVFLAMFAAGVSVMGWTLADQRLTFDLD